MNLLPFVCPHCRGSFQIPATPNGPLSCPKCAGLVADDIATVALSPTPPPQTSGIRDSQANASSAPTLSNWEVLEEIGRGGMGVVQRVRDKKLGRQAALKILRSNDASQQIEDRFLRESKVTANLDHPSIPAVFDAGRDESGQPYLLMRLVRGETLGHHIKLLHQSDPNDPRRYLEALVKVAEAVAHAHDRGIIHRDLKPENIMIGNYGDVLVMDWGLAGYKGENPNDAETRAGERSPRRLESTVSAEPNAGETELTLAGTVMGTPGYMSPEQADGAWVDERSDVFALGAILTEILTGQSPVSGESALAKIKKTLDGDFLYPSDGPSGSTPELDWIARQALAVEHEQRTESATLFVAQLRAYLAGSPVPGYPYSLQEKLEGWLRRHPFAMVVSSALAFILLITTLYGLSWQAEKDARARAEAEVRRRKKTLTQFAEARSFMRRGRPREEVIKKVKAAMLGGPRISLDEQLRATEILEEAGAYKEAEAVLQGAQAQNPGRVSILYSLHFIQLKKTGQSEELFTSTPALTELLSLSKQSQEQNEYTHFAKAQELIQARKFKEAIEELTQIEDYTSALEGAKLQKGICALKLKNYQLATTSFTDVIKRNTRSKEAYLLRGVAYWKLKQSRNLLSDCNEVLSLAPNHTKAIYFRALAREMRGDFTGAHKDFNAALNLEPSNSQAYYGRGSVSIELHRFQDAIADLSKAFDNAELGTSWNRRQSFLNVAPSLEAFKAKILCTRALAYVTEGQSELALRDLDLAEEIDQSASVYYAQAQYYRVLGNNAKAIELCTQALKLDAKFAAALRLRGETYFAGVHTAKAEKDFDKLCELEPENPQAFFFKGLVKLRSKKIGESLKAYDRSIDLEPNTPLRYFYRASARSAARQYRGALEDLEYFIKNHPQHNSAPSARTQAQQLRDYLKGQ